MKTMDDGAAARLHLPTQQNLSPRLHQLPRRASGRVTGLLPAQDAQEHSMLLRLLEIGFLPGETVQVVARGGWSGDPIAVRVGQATFALRRQEAARRPHPLQAGGRLLHGLQRERDVMADIRGDADVLLDTSNFNVHELQDRIAELFGTAASTRLKVTVISFGFKYGIPVDADWVADMRFLPNPHWVPDLRPQNGRDPAVSDYVLSQPGAGTFLEQYLPVLGTVAQGYLVEGTRFMQVAVGCSGGKHRSVAMTEAIAARMRDAGYSVRTAHRDLGRE